MSSKTHRKKTHATAGQWINSPSSILQKWRGLFLDPFTMPHVYISTSQIVGPHLHTNSSVLLGYNQVTILNQELQSKFSFQLLVLTTQRPKQERFTWSLCILDRKYENPVIRMSVQIQPLPNNHQCYSPRSLTCQTGLYKLFTSAAHLQLHATSNCCRTRKCSLPNKIAEHYFLGCNFLIIRRGIRPERNQKHSISDQAPSPHHLS